MSSLFLGGELLNRNALAEVPVLVLGSICTRLVTICKVRSIPTSVGRMKRSAVGRGGRFLQVPSPQHCGGRGGERAGGRRPAVPMEPLITLQPQMEPSGEHFSERRTLLEPGVPSAGRRRTQVHLQSTTGCGTGE